MNLISLVLKQMRQRRLSTWLTLISVALGVSLAITILIVQREGQALFAQTDFGYDILIGPPKGSPLQLTLNTAYHLDTSPGNVPYQLYEDLVRKGPPPQGRADFRSMVRMAVPFMVGDSFQGRRIIGTSPLLFGIGADGKSVSEPFEYRVGKQYELESGRIFAPKKFEAVIGSDVASKLRLRLYDDKLSEEENEKLGGAFRATHGMPRPDETPDIHKPHWHIVGILKPTHTANDRVLFVPFISLYAIAEHEAGLIDQALMKARIDPARIPPERVDEVLTKLGIDPARVPQTVRRKFKLEEREESPSPEASTQNVEALMKSAAINEERDHDHEEEDDPDAYTLDANKDIVPNLPTEEWLLSAVMVKSRTGQAPQIMYNFKVIDDRATAVNPAGVMREFFDTFLAGSTTLLLLIAILVSVVAGASITTTIYNAIVGRRREIAILRALGATRGRILMIVIGEALLIGVIGSVAGLLVGHLLGALASAYLSQHFGESINWIRISPAEVIYIVGVAILALLAGFIPARLAYRTPVAENLVVV